MADLRRYRNLVYDSARWSGFDLRPDDIVISTPAKCGTTWMQTLCAFLVFDATHFDRPLAEISLWLDQLTESLDSVVGKFEAQQHRRIIKTHTPLDGVPRLDGVTYLCVGRDPRDVSLSWAHHWSNMDLEAFVAARAAAVGLDDLAELGPPPEMPPEDPLERFWQWVDSEDGIGLAALLAQLTTYWEARHEQGVHLFHYGDLQADLVAELRRLADILGIERPDERLAELAAAATFDSMKARAEDFVPNARTGFWRDKESFFHRGQNGQWRELLDEGALRRYDARVAQLVPADLAAWAHGGWSGTSA